MTTLLEQARRFIRQQPVAQLALCILPLAAASLPAAASMGGPSPMVLGAATVGFPDNQTLDVSGSSLYLPSGGGSTTSGSLPINGNDGSVGVKLFGTADYYLKSQSKLPLTPGILFSAYGSATGQVGSSVGVQYDFTLTEGGSTGVHIDTWRLVYDIITNNPLGGSFDNFLTVAGSGYGRFTNASPLSVAIGNPGDGSIVGYNVHLEADLVGNDLNNYVDFSVNIPQNSIDILPTNNAVPEPGSLGLMATAFAGLLAAMGARRRRSAGTAHRA